MADVQKASYPLARDTAESARLAEQHRLVVEFTGYLIHPTIQRHLPPHARIADVGAGTGAWSLDASQALPNAHVVAFDISPAQFPKSYPSNVEFIVADAKQPFPKFQLGTFDFVNIRALVFALKAGEWEVVMRNVIQLLKPGGFVLWGEADNSVGRCLRSKPGFREFRALPQLLKRSTEALGSDRFGEIRKIPDVAAAEGLQNIQIDWFSNDRVPDVRTPITRQYATALYGMAEKFAFWPKQELENLKKEVEAEIDDGAYYRADVLIMVGQKPGASASTV